LEDGDKDARDFLDQIAGAADTRWGKIAVGTRRESCKLNMSDFTASEYNALSLQTNTADAVSQTNFAI
jgi:hypothetical protein